MSNLKEILTRNPSTVIPALAAFAKMHKSNVVVAKHPIKIIAHPATINYQNKVASHVKLKTIENTTKSLSNIGFKLFPDNLSLSPNNRSTMKEVQLKAKIIMHPATIEYYNKRTPFKVKPYSKREMAEMYGVCSKTFEKWINPFKDDIGKPNGRYYTVRQVTAIIERLDLPYWIDVA